MSEIGFASIFPAGLFEAGPGPVYTEPGPEGHSQVVPPIYGFGKPGPEPPAVVSIAPGNVKQAVPQGDAGLAEPGSTALTPEQTINHGFGLILLLVLIVLGLWLLFRSGQ